MAVLGVKPPAAPVVIGVPDARFVYHQNTPATTWTIAHGLGKYPSVDVYDSSGSRWFHDVIYLDANNIQLTFPGATGGVAYLN